MFDTRYNILIGWGPKPSTVAGLVWRMLWVWPAGQLAGLYVISMAALCFAAGAARLYDFHAHGGLGLLYTVFPSNVPWPFLFFSIQLISLRDPFDTVNDRAFTLLPFQRKRRMLAAWHLMIGAEHLLQWCCALFVVLILPVPLQSKMWVGLALTIYALLLIGLRASGGAMAASGSRNLPRPSITARALDYIISLAAIIAIIAIFIINKKPATLFLGAGLATVAIAWSYFRLPALTPWPKVEDGTKEPNPARENIRPRLESGAALRTTFAGNLLTGSMVGVPLLGFGWYAPDTAPLIMAPGCMFLVGGIAGAYTVAFLRPARALPLSSWSLTWAAVLNGVIAGLPYALIAMAVPPTGVAGTDVPLYGALLFAGCVTFACATPLIMAHLLFGVLAIAMPLIGVISLAGIDVHFKPYSLLSTGLYITCALFVAVVLCLRYYHLWDSKVYQAQRAAGRTRAEPQAILVTRRTGENERLNIIIQCSIGTLALLFGLAILIFK